MPEHDLSGAHLRLLPTGILGFGAGKPVGDDVQRFSHLQFRFHAGHHGLCAEAAPDFSPRKPAIGAGRANYHPFPGGAGFVPNLQIERFSSLWEYLMAGAVHLPRR